jgi:hypothetical protein
MSAILKLKRANDMNVIDQTLETVRNCLLSEPKVAAETVREQVYKSIVDILPAGCIPENVAEAAEKLFEQLVIAQNNSPKMRLIAEDDFKSLLSWNIMLNFNSTASVDTIYQDLIDRNMQSVTRADVEVEVEYLLTDAGCWRELDDK